MREIDNIRRFDGTVTILLMIMISVELWIFQLFVHVSIFRMFVSMQLKFCRPSQNIQHLLFYR